MRDVLAVYAHGNSARGDVVTPLAALVDQILRQTHFAGGTQQDAAECLMHILLATDHGGMQQRVCGANAAVSVESMIC